MIKILDLSTGEWDTFKSDIEKWMNPIDALISSAIIEYSVPSLWDNEKIRLAWKEMIIYGEKTATIGDLCVAL